MSRSDVKILAIDDSSSIRQYLRWMLGGHYHLVLAASGEEGLSVFRAQSPDIVLTSYDPQHSADSLAARTLSPWEAVTVRL